MAKPKGQPDRSTLRFSAEQVQLARQYVESDSGPLQGELKVLLYGDSQPCENEEWRLIRTSETEQYWVSDRGHFALWRERPALIWDRGYLQAVIYVNGVLKPRAVHRLVAQEFCLWNDGDIVVRHRNSNRTENHVNNLRPGIQKDNMHDKFEREHGRVPVVVPPAKEIWRLSHEYAGVRISNLGRIMLGWWLAFNTDGYFYKQGKREGAKKHVSLKIVLAHKSRYELLHRLMFEAFHGPIPKDTLIRHRIDDPHDNRLENLAPGTPADNAADRMQNGHQRSGMQHPLAKYTDAQRAEVANCLGYGMNARGVSILTGVGIQTVYQIQARIRKAAGR